MNIINFIDLGFLIILLLFLNFILSKSNFLLDIPSYSSHKIENNQKIVLSGGLFIFLSLVYFQITKNLSIEIIYLLFLILILGILSDKNILKSPLKRLIFQLFIIIFVIAIFKIQIFSTRIIFIDNLLSNYYFNTIFTVSCLLVLINGSNFIDGLNGLSCGYFFLVCLSIILLDDTSELKLSYLENFHYLIPILFVFIFFNILNKNFMGDNGIYFLSAFLGIEIIRFSNFNLGNISPIYVASILWYPAFENLFSIARRLYKKREISDPDNLHLHTVIYYKIKNKFNFKLSNNLASFIILIYCVPGFLLSNTYHNNSSALSIIILFNTLVYLISYSIFKNEK